MKLLSRDEIEALRKQYPAGSRIVLSHMSDPYNPVEPGTKGTLDHIDDLGTLHIIWDNGRTLGLIYGEDRFSVFEQPVKEVAKNADLPIQPINTQKDSVLSFVFDDEIYVSDDLCALEGYLIATDSLVTRLKQQGQLHLSSDELSSMENINFYPVYNVQKRSVTLHSHFYFSSAAGEQSKGFVLPLSAEESHLLISGFEAYCKARYNTSCAALLNEVREKEGKQPLSKPSLQERLEDIHIGNADTQKSLQCEKTPSAPER